LLRFLRFTHALLLLLSHFFLLLALLLACFFDLALPLQLLTLHVLLLLATGLLLLLTHLFLLLAHLLLLLTGLFGALQLLTLHVFLLLASGFFLLLAHLLLLLAGFFGGFLILPSLHFLELLASGFFLLLAHLLLLLTGYFDALLTGVFLIGGLLFALTIAVGTILHVALWIAAISLFPLLRITRLVGFFLASALFLIACLFRAVSRDRGTIRSNSGAAAIWIFPTGCPVTGIVPSVTVVVRHFPIAVPGQTLLVGWPILDGSGARGDFRAIRPDGFFLGTTWLVAGLAFRLAAVFLETLAADSVELVFSSQFFDGAIGLTTTFGDHLAETT
jgi:hypothetical protein